MISGNTSYSAQQFNVCNTLFDANFFHLHFRRDYLKALHMDPLCLSARVNLGYNLQVKNNYLFLCMSSLTD